jgi:hypothetical protein
MALSRLVHLERLTFAGTLTRRACIEIVPVAGVDGIKGRGWSRRRIPLTSKSNSQNSTLLGRDLTTSKPKKQDLAPACHQLTTCCYTYILYRLVPDVRLGTTRQRLDASLHSFGPLSVS